MIGVGMSLRKLERPGKKVKKVGKEREGGLVRSRLKGGGE